MVRIMASLSMTKARGCPECGQVHDCAWFVEMQVLTKRLDDKINEIVKSKTVIKLDLLLQKFQNWRINEPPFNFLLA